MPTQLDAIDFASVIVQETMEKEIKCISFYIFFFRLTLPGKDAYNGTNEGYIKKKKKSFIKKPTLSSSLQGRAEQTKKYEEIKKEQSFKINNYT